MATLKLIFRASTLPSRQGTLFFRVIHKRKVCLVNTGVKIYPQEWDANDFKPIGRNASNCLSKIEAVRTRLDNIISILANSKPDYSAHDVIDMYHDSDTIVGFISYARKLISSCRKSNRLSAADHYTSATNSFLKFLDSDEIRFDRIDTQLICSYEAFLKGEGLCPNTTSYYMRKLRAIYNLAVEEKLTIQRNPFDHVYTGVAKTRKRSMKLKELKMLQELDLSESPLDSLARDIVLFSFFTRGMSTVDIAYLKKTDLKNGVLTYSRQKTGQRIEVKWEKAMQDITDKYADNNSIYMFPLIRNPGKDERRQYINASHLINHHLKDLGKLIGMSEPLTTYVARHTWASLAHENDIPLSVISQGMGHDSEKTTKIYLAALDRSKLDEANNAIISLLT